MSDHAIWLLIAGAFVVTYMWRGLGVALGGGLSLEGPLFRWVAAVAYAMLAGLIAPVTPHLAEECWARLGKDGLVAEAPWPRFDPALAQDDAYVMPVQVNGKRRGELLIRVGASEDEIRDAALADEAVKRHLEGVSIRKIVFVPNRILNFVVG